ncbi:MAG: MATE family efflux transporter [Gudongella sp.]|jgi:putative MATE family efflux protein|nr:MATE family efflux transporter [Gudongella sp.]
MPQLITSEEKHRKMTKEPVEKLINSLAAPTIVSMLITAIYNMADTFFVSKISTSASAAVGVSFALMAIIQAIGFTFGTGSGNYISRLLGQKDKRMAEKVAATGFFTSLGTGIVLAVLGLIYLDPLVMALGATKTIAPYAKDYIRFILIGMPYMMNSFVLSHILRFQGNAFYAMIGIGIGGVLNIILDPIFIFVLDMGIGGAALATIISQFVGFSLLMRNSSVGDNVSIKLKNYTLSTKIFKEIFKNGIPSFYRQTLASTAMIFLNFSAGAFGDAAVAAVSIVARIMQFSVSAVLGFAQGFQPVCGFNYGAGNFDRVLKAFWYTVRVVVSFLVVVGAAAFIFSPYIIKLFRKEDLEVVRIGTRALRYQSLTLPLSAWIISANMLVQTIGKSTRASFISISRQGLFFIPAILFLPGILGIEGVILSQPIANVLSFLGSIVVTAGVIKELSKGASSALKSS